MGVIPKGTVVKQTSGENIFGTIASEPFVYRGNLCYVLELHTRCRGYVQNENCRTYISCIVIEESNCLRYDGDNDETN